MSQQPPSPPPYPGQPYPEQPQYPAQQYPALQYPAQQYPPQPYAQPYPQYAAAPPNNSLAVVSLISGIVGWTILPFIASIVAVITGHMARKQIAATGESGAGMATAGLVLGYVMIGLSVVSILIAVLVFGVFAAAVGTAGTLEY